MSLGQDRMLDQGLFEEPEERPDLHRMTNAAAAIALRHWDAAWRKPKRCDCNSSSDWRKAAWGFPN